MLLRGRYYKIDGWNTEEGETTFRITLLPDCDVYRGHFPGKPVCPGVCNVQVVKECAMLLTGKQLSITAIRQKRPTIFKVTVLPPVFAPLKSRKL